jgi:hypothetical protein
MTKEEIEAALEALGRELAARGESADVVVAGGAWMILMTGNRAVTRDVDAYIAPPTGPVRLAVARVAEEMGLPTDWLNDGVKGFFYSQPPQFLWRDYPGLTVYAVTADYLLAMKALAAREGDREDARTLIRMLGLNQPDDVLAIVERYMPPRVLTSRVAYFVESLFDEGDGVP